MRIKLPEHRHAHIFRDTDGHLTDTPENRSLLIDLVNDPLNLAGYDKRNHAWYVCQTRNGNQLWAIVRNDEIINGGLNTKPKIFHPQSGLSKPEK